MAVCIAHDVERLRGSVRPEGVGGGIGAEVASDELVAVDRRAVGEEVPKKKKARRLVMWSPILGQRIGDHLYGT